MSVHVKKETYSTKILMSTHFNNISIVITHHLHTKFLKNYVYELFDIHNMNKKMNQKYLKLNETKILNIFLKK